MNEMTTRPWDSYDTETVGQLMARLVNMNDADRARILAYERKHKKRRQVIWIMVNWNS